RSSARVRGALAGSVVAVGASRLYVGVHHLSDVVAGVAVGVLAARAAHVARRWCRLTFGSGDAQRQAASDDRA
ncbi:MAG: phosphatase PAP2 family protein, partial [Nitriliruptoraceae bacterium]